MIAYANHLGDRAPRRHVVSLGLPNHIELVASIPVCGTVFAPMPDNIQPQAKIEQKRKQGKPAALTKEARAARIEKMLSVMREEGPISSGDLSAEVGLHRASAFKTLAILEERGVVVRIGEGHSTKWAAA